MKVVFCDGCKERVTGEAFDLTIRIGDTKPVCTTSIGEEIRVSELLRVVDLCADCKKRLFSYADPVQWAKT